MDSNWHVIRTEPRAEYLAADELDRDGFEVFFPRIKVAHPRCGHSDTPIFPGYLFLRLDAQMEGWPVFRPRHRVVNWVRFGDEIPSLPDDAVAELRQRVDTINGEGGLWRGFKPGDKVRVISNTIQGLAEVIEGAKSPQGRVKVLLEFMGRLVRAQIPWDALRPVEEESEKGRRPLRRTRGGGRWIAGFGLRAPDGAYSR